MKRFLTYLVSVVVCCFTLSGQTKDAAYYRSKGYQVYESLGFAIKGEIRLEDISSRANTDFTLNLGGIEDANTSRQCFYQLMISALPIGRKDLSEATVTSMVDKKLKEAMSSFRNVKAIRFSENAYQGYYGETSHNGMAQKGVMFYRDGYVYALTAISNYNLEQRFNVFTNAIVFFTPDRRKSPVSGYRQYVKEIGCYVSAPCRLVNHSEPGYDCIYEGATADDPNTGVVYKVSINFLPMSFSKMTASDQATIKRNLRNYAASKQSMTACSLSVDNVMALTASSFENGYNIKEAIILTDSSVIELIVASKEDVSSAFNLFVKSFSK